MVSLCIVAPNIKNGGGKELLEYLIEYFEEHFTKIYTTVYLDISLSHIKKTNNRDVIYLSSPFDKIKLFNKKIDNAIYFGNLPPVHKSNNSAVYFHNPYLTMPFKDLRKQSLKFFIKYSLQQIYIKTFIKNVDFVACQNNKVKKAFIALYGYNKVKLFPFFRLCECNPCVKVSKVYDFCYISLAHPHKRHIELLDAIDILSDKGVALSVALTIEDCHDYIINKIHEINRKGIVTIVNLGVLSKEDVCKVYAKSKALVFPSVQETFGLALIEAANMNLDIIAADLGYVYEAVKPSLVFDPNDPKDIANKLLMNMNGECHKSEPIIKNKIDEFISSIVSNYVE